MTTYQHVDDLTSMCIAKGEPQLKHNMISYAVALHRHMTRLKLTLSSKSAILPIGDTTRAVAETLRRA